MANPLIRSTFLTVITFLKHKAEEKGLKPIITVSKLIDMLNSSGLNITYQQLADMAKDPIISPSIKSINKNQVEFNIGDEEATAPEELLPKTATPPENDESSENGDFNPDDFEGPENDEEQTQENPNNEMEDQGYRNQESTISQMAKRAAARAD
jgi:hypothetical protein